MSDDPQVGREPDADPPHPPTGGAGVISVALIDDSRLVREGIASLLKPVPDLNVVGTGSGADLGFLDDAKPQIVLLVVGLRNGDGLRLAETIRSRLPESRIVVMDLLPVQEQVLGLVHAGVSGFIMKDTSVESLFSTIRSVAAGENVLPPEMTANLFSQIAQSATEDRRTGETERVRMTMREREVIGLISEGLGNKKIADRLDISVHTVKSHVRKIMEKLALHTRLQIAAYAHHREDPVD